MQRKTRYWISIERRDGPFSWVAVVQQSGHDTPYVHFAKFTGWFRWYVKSRAEFAIDQEEAKWERRRRKRERWKSHERYEYEPET